MGAKYLQLDVLDKERVQPGTEYILKQLPDGVNFLFNDKRYRTITYPKYKSGALNTDTRPCLNLVTLKEEELSFSELVKTV